MRAAGADFRHLAHDSTDPDQCQRGISVGDQPAYAAAQGAAGQAERTAEDHQQPAFEESQRGSSCIDKETIWPSGDQARLGEIGLRPADRGRVELEAAKQEEEAQTVRFRSCVRHLEEYGQMSYIAILLEATSLSDLLARMDMVGEVIAYNKQVQADMTAAREKVETVKAELEDARTELQDKQSELETKQVALQQKVSEANALLVGLESDINAYKSVYDQYEQQQKNVQSQIDKQVEELRRQEEANKNNNPGYDPGKANGSTGTMMWPCPSCHYITSPFGWRYHPIYQTQKYHSGVDIGASYGATIVAADGGTIITAGSVSGYGNCVVINHGRHHRSTAI
ncbi:MAG: murein hydrolase activator EnvC family protein [Oscillospiraceae bacterium]